jgi:uncharacterized protein (TIGR00730 family)
MPDHHVVAVFGSATIRPGEPAYRDAHDLGAALARAGAVVMTGGYGGAMEACSRGAHDAGGHVIGVTVEIFESRGPVNAWVKERVHTTDLFERLRCLVDRADAFVVLPGSLGTLAELFVTWNLLSTGHHEAPLILLGEHWQDWIDALRAPGLVPVAYFEHALITADLHEAARWAAYPAEARATRAPAAPPLPR